MKNVLSFTGFLLLFFSSYFMNAQVNNQRVKGVLLDVISEYPLPGAVVELHGVDTVFKTMTDFDGAFEFRSVPIGTYSIQASMIGFESVLIDNIVVNTGKEKEVKLLISEKVESVDEVVITAPTEKGHAKNKNAIVSARSFTVEETQRYPGSFEDPARMSTSFAGVAANPQGNNDIIVRGNSPRGVLWRIEGVESPNPNHFAADGASGGAVSMLSNFALANSDFYSSAFPAEFGNATSSVFDIRLRKGNKDKQEYSVDLNTLGIKVSAEGPIKKGKKASYLVNYRYSTLGILENLGVFISDGLPKYQDLVYKVNMPTKNAGVFSVFGLAGFGNLTFEEKDENNEDLVVQKGLEKYVTGITGLKHLYFFNDKTSITSVVSYQGKISDSESNSLNPDLTSFNPDYQSDWLNSKLQFQTELNKKVNAKHSLSSGIYIDQIGYDMDINGFDYDLQESRNFVKGKGSSTMLRGYFNWRYQASNKLLFISGVHYSNFLLNGSQALEPRLSSKIKVAKNHELTLGYGLHSRRENLSVYLVDVVNEEGVFGQYNKDLGFSRAHHFVLGHETHLSKNVRLMTEVYYQSLFNQLVDSQGSSYALLNEPEGFSDRVLTNDGVGENYGLELTLERFFTNNYFFLVTTSLYQSKYKTLENKWRNTRYNGNYIANFMGGKEFDISRNGKQRSFMLSGKFAYLGGLRDTPIDLEVSSAEGHTVYDETQAWDEKLNDVTRIDVQFKIKTNRKRSTREWLLDLQNVTNNETTIGYYYSNYNQSIKKSVQLQIIPMLSYKVIF